MTLKLLVAGLCAALMGCGAGGGADGNPDAGAGGGGADDRGGAGAGGDGGVPDAGPPGMPTVTPAPEFDSDVSRQFATLVELADGRVFVAGGFSGREEIEIFDVANRTYVEVAPLKQGRHGASSVLLADGKVLVTGGVGGPPGEIASLDSAELFDPVTGDTTLLPETMNIARRYHGSWLLASGSHAGKVLIAGGATRGAPEVYDPATGMFTPLGATRAPPGGLEGGYSVLLDDEQVVFLGTQNELAESRGYHRYDPEAGAFDDLGVFTDTDYSRYTVTKQHDGRVLIAGGFTDEGSTSMAIFDPSDDSVGPIGQHLNRRRYLHSAGVLPSGRVALISGVSMPGEDGAISTVAIWDPVAETVSDADGEVSVGRAYSQALTLTSGQIFVIGGQVVLARGNTAIVANVDIISE